MPKTIIEFTDDDQQDLEMCQNGWRYHGALWEFKQYLRNEIKYGDHTEKEYEILDKIQENFFEILNDNKAHLE